MSNGPERPAGPLTVPLLVLLCTSLLLVLLNTSRVAQATPDSRIDAAGGSLLVEWDSTLTAAERSQLTLWLERAAQTTATLHGRLPREEIRVVIKVSRDAAQPVPFAQVIRSATQGVRFWVNPAHPLDDFLRDWTAAHEFTHLLIPWPGQRDIWLSEGLATYYQYLLLARDGLLEECAAWEKIHAGFTRGEANAEHAGLSLAELSTRLRATRAYMRVYWTGTAYFLEADLALRAVRAGLTLDSVLRDFGECCLNDPAITTGRELVSAFDRIAGQAIFVPLYERYRQLEGMPDFPALLARVGVRPDGDGVRCDNEPAAAAALLRQITRGEPSSP